MVCAVLAPIMMLLSDPDTWNQLVEAVGKSMLQDRKNVKKLRAALDEHATPRSRRSGASSDSAGVRVVPFLRLFPSDDERTFERFIRSIRQCNNLSDARRMRNEISSQLKKDSKIKGRVLCLNILCHQPNQREIYRSRSCIYSAIRDRQTIA